VKVAALESVVVLVLVVLALVLVVLVLVLVLVLVQAWPGNHLGYCTSWSNLWNRDRLVHRLEIRRKCSYHPTCSSNSWDQHLPEKRMRPKAEHEPWL